MVVPAIERPPGYLPGHYQLDVLGAPPGIERLAHCPRLAHRSPRLVKRPNQSRQAVAYFVANRERHHEESAQGDHRPYPAGQLCPLALPDVCRADRAELA